MPPGLQEAHLSSPWTWSATSSCWPDLACQATSRPRRRISQLQRRRSPWRLWSRLRAPSWGSLCRRRFHSLWRHGMRISHGPPDHHPAWTLLGWRCIVFQVFQWRSVSRDPWELWPSHSATMPSWGSHRVHVPCCPPLPWWCPWGTERSPSEGPSSHRHCQPWCWRMHETLPPFWWSSFVGTLEAKGGNPLTSRCHGKQRTPFHIQSFDS